jgi:hypothetical protein
MEWLMLVKEYVMDDLKEKTHFHGEAWKWWISIDFDSRWNMTWEEFEKLFSDKWIRDTKMEELYRIKDELKDEKENIKNNGDELSNI